MTISEPSSANQSPAGVISSDGSSLPFHIYNWHTGSWDSISLNNDTFTTKNVSAYIGPGGRVLLQIANNDTSLGTLVFSKPSLNLQGVVLGS
jgi:hypothetical protein